MAEYIEKEALMRQIKETHCAECNSYHGVRCRACWVDDTLGYIDSEPAAEVAQVLHGRWKVEVGMNFFKERNCPVCKKRIESNFCNYCPNCGAKMDGDRL